MRCFRFLFQKKNKTRGNKLYSSQQLVSLVDLPVQKKTAAAHENQQIPANNKKEKKKKETTRTKCETNLEYLLILA